MKRYLVNAKVIEVDVPDNLSDEDIIEGYNVGDIEGFEVDGRIEMQEAELREDFSGALAECERVE